MSKQDVYAAQAAFEGALATYEAFRAQHADVLDEHDHLAVLFSESLEAYKNTLRENAAIMGKTVGSFSISIPKSYDADELRRLIGPKADPYLITKYSIDSKKFEEAVDKGYIDRKVADQVVGHGSPRINGGPKAPSIYQR